MAITRFGFLDDFSQKNDKVGIGTSTATEKLEILGGTKSKDGLLKSRTSRDGRRRIH